MSFFSPMPGGSGSAAGSGKIGEIATVQSRNIPTINTGGPTNYNLCFVTLTPGIWLVSGTFVYQTQATLPTGLTTLLGFIQSTNAAPTGLNVYGWSGNSPTLTTSTLYRFAIPATVFNVTTTTSYALYARVTISTVNSFACDGNGSDICAVRIA